MSEIYRQKKFCKSLLLTNKTLVQLTRLSNFTFLILYDQWLSFRLLKMLCKAFTKPQFDTSNYFTS